MSNPTQHFTCHGDPCFCICNCGLISFPCYMWLLHSSPVSALPYKYSFCSEVMFEKLPGRRLDSALSARHNSSTACVWAIACRFKQGVSAPANVASLPDSASCQCPGNSCWAIVSTQPFHKHHHTHHFK